MNTIVGKITAWGRKWWAVLVGGILGLLVLLSKIKLSDAQKKVRGSGEAVNKAREEVGKAEAVIDQSEKVIKQSEDTISNAKKTIEAEEEKLAKRKQKDKDLSKRLDKLPLLIVAVLLPIIFISSMSFAENGNAQIPLSYDELMKNYIEAVDIAHQYQELYRDAEKSNENLLAKIKELTAQLERNTEQMKAQQDQIKSLTEVVTNLQKWIGELQNTIMKLLGKPIEISGGVTIRKDIDGRLTPEGFASVSVKIF